MKRHWYISLLRCVIILVAMLFVLLPVLWMVSTSLKPTEEVMSGEPYWIPKRFSLGAYANLFSEYPFASYFKNSVIVSFFTTLIAVFFSLLAAYGVTRYSFKGRQTFLTYLLITQMFPTIMMLIPSYQILKNFGLQNRLAGLVVLYTAITVPFCSWLMKGYLETIPLELDEAAMIDGCPRVRIIFQIIAPLSLPGIAATAIYSFIQTWNEYMFAYILISTEIRKTLPVGIGQMNGYYKTNWNEMMAACLIGSLPVILLFIALQRHFIASLSAGAVKE